MICSHGVDSLIFEKSSSSEYESDILRNLNCICCLTSVIFDQSLEHNIRQLYANKYLNFIEVSNLRCETIICSEKLIDKSITAILRTNSTELLEKDQCTFTVLQCLFLLASPKLKLKLSQPLTKVRITFIALSCFAVYWTTSQLRIRRFQVFQDLSLTLDLITNYIFVLINTISSYLESFSICYLNCLLKHLPRKCFESVRISFQKVAELILRNKNRDVVEIGLDCLFKLSLCNQSFVEICKYKELPVVLRALLNSNDDQIKEITFIFIELLVDKFNGDATKLICTSGVIELLFGNISFKNPCFRNVLKCLQRIGTEVELMSSGFVPHGISQIVKAIDSNHDYENGLLPGLVKITNSFIMYYNGPLELFICPSILGQFLKAISDIMEDCTAQLGILGITCVANIFKETESMPLKELNKFLNFVERFARKQIYNSRHLKQSNKECAISKSDMKIEEKSLCILLPTLLSLLREVHAFLYTNKRTPIKIPEVIMETECSLTYIFFSVVMNLVSQLMYKNVTVEDLLSVLRITTMYAYGICSDILVKEITNICGGIFEQFQTFKNCVSNALKDKICESFTLLLPLFYKICFLVGTENVKPALFSPGYHTFNDKKRELSVPFCSMSFPKEVLLAVITINSSIYNNLSISHLSKRRHLTDVLKRDEFKIWISTLVRGFKYFTSVDFEYLEKYMELSIRGQEFIDISASAISIVCVLINRNIKHIKKLQRSPLVEDGDHEANSLRHCFIFPSKTLKQIIQFPTKAGVNFFLLVSVLITVEFLITYMCLPKFRNVFDNSAIIDEYNKGLDILSLALFDRLQPVHTLVLLRTPRFSTYLENCSPCWIKMAQKIILQCHSDELLIEEQVFSLLPTTYILLSNTWTVWYNSLIKFDNADVLQRLVLTFEIQTLSLKEKDGSIETSHSSVQRKQLALYICDCLSVLPNNLPGSFSDVFTSNYELKYAYVKMLKVTCMFLHEVFLYSQFVIMVAQQIIGLLANERFDPNSSLRNDLLKIILHLLMNSDSNTQVQIIKLLCSEIQTWESCIFRFSKETSEGSAANRLKIHTEKFQITAAEWDSILGIAASINICTKHLSVNHDIVDSVSSLLFMNPETILAILSHNQVTNGSPFIESSALVCLLESFYGPLSHLLWPDISENSSENYYYELFMCLNTKIMDITHRFTQELSIEVYGCLIKYICLTTTKQSFINMFLLTNPWSNIILEHLQIDGSVNNVEKFSSSFLAFANVLLSTKCPAICSVLNKNQLRELLLAYIHDEGLYDSITKTYLGSISLKIASPDFEVLDSRERLCLEIMVASDNLQPTLSISNRFNLFYKKIFCL
uniref:Ig-like domain-containing protein n=1 Tax=Schistosoma mansoni TaxID=6183 RepID=A0A5K4F3I8_SCHMA